MDICVYCKSPAQGRFSVHRDDFCEGPEVPLCDACGGDEEPTLEEIWNRISTTQRTSTADRARRQGY